jgi:hypothetical protein
MLCVVNFQTCLIIGYGAKARTHKGPHLIKFAIDFRSSYSSTARKGCTTKASADYCLLLLARNELISNF